MKYHPDHGGNADDFKRLYDAYDKAKNASVNGLPDGVAPEATMAAGAGVAASGMEGQMNPEARKMAEQIWQASERVVSDESNVWSDIKKQNEAKRKKRYLEVHFEYSSYTINLKKHSIRVITKEELQMAFTLLVLFKLTIFIKKLLQFGFIGASLPLYPSYHGSLYQ